MNEAKLKGLMGLCVRAGQAVFGEDGCLKTLRGGQCGALLLDGEASGNTREKYQSICERENVPFILLPEGMLEEATGRPGVAMAVRKGNLAEQVLGCL